MLIAKNNQTLVSKELTSGISYIFEGGETQYVPNTQLQIFIFTVYFHYADVALLHRGLTVFDTDQDCTLSRWKDASRS